MASRALPNKFRRMMVNILSQKFRKSVIVETVPVPKPAPNEVLVRNCIVGINASDINASAGRYEPKKHTPFAIGFEGLGEVIETGENIQGLQPGQAVAYMTDGAFSEYITIPEKVAMPIPAVEKEYVAFMVSGLTAAISLDKVGEIKSGETVLVTAAAGGTGQFAVQWAKQKGCHVIGTCSSEEKVEFLKSIGCDRAINYNEEDLRSTLKKEYPNGIDVVYESVGGEFFDIAVDRLAIKGRIVLIGFIQGYQTAAGIITDYKKAVTMPPKLLTKSASVRGFFLFHYTKDWKPYLQQLIEMYQEEKLKVGVDDGSSYETGPFKGIEAVYDAVDYLYSKKSKGKIVVDIASKL